MHCVANQYPVTLISLGGCMKYIFISAIQVAGDGDGKSRLNFPSENDAKKGNITDNASSLT